MEDFTTLIGRFYQIRDDYMNLVSTDVRNSPIPSSPSEANLLHSTQTPKASAQTSMKESTP